jgi:hypothetical protein
MRTARLARPRSPCLANIWSLHDAPARTHMLVNLVYFGPWHRHFARLNPFVLAPCGTAPEAGQASGRRRGRERQSMRLVY